MKYAVMNDQYVFFIESASLSLFYNNQNGKIAFSDHLTNLDDTFFSVPTDIDINLIKTQYEQLYLAISESCNFRCKYCRQKKSDSIINMTFDEIKNAIDVFYYNSPVPKSIVFFGGEPLLNFAGIKYAIEYVRSFDSKIKFSMVINGSLCTKEIATFFCKNDVEVIVSLDGPEKIHNIARVNTNLDGTYQAAIKGYNTLKEAGCTTGITTVIGPHNEHCFHELVEWAIMLQPHSLGFCLPHGDHSNFAMNISSFERIHKQMIEAYDVLNENGINLVQVEQKIAAFVLGYSVPFECKACGKRIVACPGKRFGICEGPITNSKMFSKDINDLQEMIQLYKKTSPFTIPSCRSCIAYRICGGSCVYDKITRHGRTDIPDVCRCGLNRMIVEKAMTKLLEYSVDNGNPHILTDEERLSAYNYFTSNLI